MFLQELEALRSVVIDIEEEAEEEEKCEEIEEDEEEELFN